MRRILFFVAVIALIFPALPAYAACPTSGTIDFPCSTNLPEPASTKGTTNIWYVNWAHPAAYYGGEVRFNIYDVTNGSPGTLVSEQTTGCFSDCGGAGTGGSGQVWVDQSGLLEGHRYTMCSYTVARLGYWTNVVYGAASCNGSVMDNTKPRVSALSFGGEADYITNPAAAQPVWLHYEDQSSAPWNANFLAVTLKNSSGSTYHTGGYTYYPACSSSPQDLLWFSGWWRWYYSCTFTPQTYATGAGVTLQDGPIGLNAKVYDGVGRANNTWESTPYTEANWGTSESFGPVNLILDRVPPTVQSQVNDNTAAPGQTLSFTTTGSTDLTSGIDATKWSWNFGDGGTGSGAGSSHAYSAAGNYTVTVTGRDRAGWSQSATLNVSVTSGGGGGGSVVPSNTVPPSISGLPAVGQAISCAAGSWAGSPSPTFSYSWLRNGVVIAGASSSSYLTVGADAGKQLSCRVSATNSAGSASSTSSAVTISSSTTPTAPSASSLPTLTGTFALDGVVSCLNGGWVGSQPISYTFSWSRNGVLIAGQTASTYKVVLADTARNLSCQVRAANSVGAKTVGSTARFVTGVLPRNLVRPKISGTAKVGKKLTCYKKSWTGSSPLTYKYRWLRNGKGISAATKSTYLIKKADRKKYLSCKVTARNSVGSASKVSVKTTRVR